MTHSLVVIKLTQWILIFVDKNRRSYLTEIKRFHVWLGNVGRYESSVEMLFPIDRLENAGEQRRIFNANRRQTALCNLRTGELSRPLVGVRPCPCALLCARTLSHGSSHGNGNVRASVPWHPLPCLGIADQMSFESWFPHKQDVPTIPIRFIYFYFCPSSWNPQFDPRSDSRIREINKRERQETTRAM